MALIIKDRVQETSTTSGTGTLTLAGAVTGYQSFGSAIGSGNTTYYGIYETQTTNWEVGIGTVGSGTLARTTVLASSNAGSLVSFGGGQLAVWGDMPAAKGVYQDTNGNVFANNFIPNTTITASSATPINLTVASAQYQIVTGTTTSQTFNMPDATTLTVGDTYYFNNNITYSSVQLNAHDGTTSLLALQAGGAAHLILLTNGTTNGTWDVHSYVPGTVSWGTATLNFNSSSSISGPVSWQGNAVGVAYGGTGLTSTPANGALDIGNGTGFTRTTLTAGTGISVTNGSGSISIANTGVTSVTGTAPVVSSGGTTPAISMAAANSTTNGYLTSTDWNTFNNKQPSGTYINSVSGTTNQITASTTSGAVTLSLPTSVTTGQYIANQSTSSSANKGAFAYGTLGYSDTNIMASFASSVSNYNQVVLQNTSNNAAASTNFNVSNDSATSTTNFGEFGINSSGFTGSGAFSTAGYVYLASASTDLAIGTYGSNAIHFVVNSGATDSATVNGSTGVWTFASTISGSISGNAGTVTNGVYTTGSYASPSWLTSISGSIISGGTINGGSF